MTADPRICAVCAIGNETVPATHRGSTFGVRPDREDVFFCCTHAAHPWLYDHPDPVLDGAVCEVEQLMAANLADEDVPDRATLQARAFTVPTSRPRPPRRPVGATAMTAERGRVIVRVEQWWSNAYGQRYTLLDIAAERALATRPTRAEALAYAEKSGWTVLPEGEG